MRGDVNKVTIGENSSIGDRAVVHVAKIQGDFATSIGSNVTVGPCAVVHACTLEDACVVGASAQVMDGSVVQSNSIVAPGSVVTPGTTVKGGTLWAGSPAKEIRELTPAEVESIVEAAADTAELAAMHASECAKDYHQIALENDLIEDAEERDPEYLQPTLYEDKTNVRGQGTPGPIFNTSLSHPEEGLKKGQQ